MHEKCLALEHEIAHLETVTLYDKHVGARHCVPMGSSAACRPSHQYDAFATGFPSTYSTLYTLTTPIIYTNTFACIPICYVFIFSSTLIQIGALPPSLLIFTPTCARSQFLALALYALALTLLDAPAIALASSLSCGRSGTNCRATTKRSRCRLSWRHFLLVPPSQGRYDMSH